MMNTDEIYDAVKKNYLYSEKWQHNFRGEYVVIKEDLRMMFKEIYSLNVTVHLYGSRVVGLANEDSDLNIYIDTNFSYKRPNSLASCEFFVNTYAQKFRENEKWKNVKIWLSNKNSLPIIKAHHISTDIVCTISFASGYNVEHSQLLRSLYNLQPNTRKFAHFVHHCLQERNGFALFNKDVWNLLIIFYLQVCKFLPSVKSVQDLAPKQFLIGEMDVRHNVLSDISLHDVIELKSYKGHMIDFFEFYKTFDFEDFILDIHLGQPIKKLVNGRAPVMIFGPYVSKSVLQFREKEWIRDFRMFCGKIAERLIELKRESAMKFKLRKRRFDPFRRPTSCPPPVATIKRQRQRKYFNERKKSGEIKEMRTKRENQVFWGRVLAMPILK